MAIIYDIESASLDFDSEVYCIAICEEDGSNNVLYSNDTNYPPIYDGLQRLNRADEVYGWNNLAFDSWILKKQYKLNLGKKEHDGIILARILYSRDYLMSLDMKNKNMPSNLKGSFSLEAFGFRTRNYKIDFKDFSHFTEEMGIYCKQDANLTANLIRAMRKDEHYPPQLVIDIEEEAARIVASQSIYGWEIDVEKALVLKNSFEKKMVLLKNALRKKFKPKFLPDGGVKTSSTGRIKAFGLKVENKFNVDTENEE